MPSGPKSLFLNPAMDVLVGYSHDHCIIRPKNQAFGTRITTLTQQVDLDESPGNAAAALARSAMMVLVLKSFL